MIKSQSAKIVSLPSQYPQKLGGKSILSLANIKLKSKAFWGKSNES